MPVINLDYGDFARLYGGELSQEKFLETIPLIGADVDRVEGTELAVEFFPDRPDLFSVEGVARAMRAFTGHAPGLTEYQVTPPTTSMEVYPSVLPVRPFVACAVVKGVTLDEKAIIAMMELQEKLHLTLGRKRSKVSIGVHDLDPLRPPFRYLTVRPRTISFVPLQMRNKMNLEEILLDHPKGQAYAHLMKGFDRYPLILDADQQVLSFPPIINGTLTTVTEQTTNLFLEVTGLDMPAVEQALNIVVCAMVERGGSVEQVTLRYPEHPAMAELSGQTRDLPDLTPTTWRVTVPYLQGLLGWPVGSKDLVTAFLRMGLGAQLHNSSHITVQVPRYRWDLLHQIDLVEEAAIGLGYLNAPEALPTSMTFGRRRPQQERAEAACEALVGLGFQEVMTLSLSDPKAQFQRMGLDEDEAGSSTKLANPIGQEYSLLRVSLLPGLLEVLAANTHRELPQLLFEVGQVVVNHKNLQHMAFVALEPRANFTRAKGLTEALLQKLGLDITMEPISHPAFIPGRCARVIHASRVLGHFGELAPQTILDWELAHPLIAAEFDVP